MVPAAFVTLAVLPQTAHSKVDRRALARIAPTPDGAAPALPRNPVEEVLAGLWADLLKLDRVGPDSHFFELGGHSLLATRLVSRLRETLRVELPLQEVFEAPTLAGLAARVADALGGVPAVRPPVVPTGKESGPLSFAQERLWFLDRLEGGGGATYHIPTALRLHGALDIAALTVALGEVVRRHGALRTVFWEEAEGPRQIVLPADGFELPVVDLTQLAAAAREEQVAHWGREVVRRPFDLAAGPLFRVLLLTLADQERVLVSVVHHIVSDGWSTGVLVREIAALYRAFHEGAVSPLPALPVQYLDYALWQREWLVGDVLARQVAWWVEELAGVPAVIELPADRPRPPVPSHRGGVVSTTLPAELTAGIGALARRSGTTPFMVLLAALQTLFHRQGGQSDVLVGTPVASRTQSEVEGLIGFFVNTLVLRGRFAAEGLVFRGLLEQTRQTALQAYAHQDLPFERLVEELGVERSLAHGPLFQVMLVLENVPDATTLELPGLVLAPVAGDPGVAKFDLAFGWSEAASRLAGVVEYARDLFDESTVERMVGHLQRLLAGAVGDPERRLTDLPLLSGEEEAQLTAWNETGVAYPEGSALLFELIGAQIERTPDAVAASFAEQFLSYRAFGEQARRLAAHLAFLGVGR
jgi:acyl carrier protein